MIGGYYLVDSGTAGATNTWMTTGATTTTTGWIGLGNVVQWVDTTPLAPVRKLTEGEYDLPDGSLLVIDALGNYKIHDENAKVIYRACRIREFNPYINASDLLEAFIKEVGQYDGVDQSEVLRLPIEAFINWIILQAATRDGDPVDNLPSVESAIRRNPELTG